MTNHTQDKASLEERSRTRPALRPVEMAPPPEGRKTLPGCWWRDDFPPGTTLRWRHECAVVRERAAKTRKPRKRPRAGSAWDREKQKADRRYARWLWEFDPERLWTPSLARH